MAQSVRDIKRRMQTIKNTQQITRAMEMIAAVKLRRAQDKVMRTRPQLEQIEASLARVVAAAYQQREELPEIARPREGERACLVVVTSDRGLAGGYNANILRAAQEFVGEHQDCDLVLIGRKARDFFRHRNRSYLADFVFLGDDIRFRQAQDISRVIQEFYLGGIFDQVYVLYTRFVNSVTQRVTRRKVLPFDELKAPAQGEGVQPLYLFEPSITAVLEEMVPFYLDTVLYQMLAEASASEQGARMNAMRSATDNAGELINELNLSFNRARQAGITKEITEIVGGAEALQG